MSAAFAAVSSSASPFVVSCFVGSFSVSSVLARGAFVVAACFMSPYSVSAVRIHFVVVLVPLVFCILLCLIQCTDYSRISNPFRPMDLLTLCFDSIFNFTQYVD